LIIGRINHQRRGRAESHSRRATPEVFHVGNRAISRASNRKRGVPISSKDRVMTHKFNIGQTVDLMPRVLRAAASGPYQIRFLVPSSDEDPGDPHYRIKSVAEKHERVAPESELTLSEQVFA
jgi:hypothetical protein